MKTVTFIFLSFFLSSSYLQTIKANSPDNNTHQKKGNMLKSETICVDHDKFCFKIQHDSKGDAELLELYNRINDKIIYITMVNYASENEYFTVSKYTAKNKVTSDSTFEIAVGTKALLNGDEIKNYTLIDYGKYEKNGKVLRFKISNPFSDKEDVVCIMYYFMKDDFSNVQYEIKATCGKKNIASCKKFLENIALSVGLH